MNVLGTITLDMQRPSYVVVYAVQFDKLTRQITAQLTDKGLPWNVPTGALMTIRYSKPDGTQGFYDTLEDGTTAYTISGSAVTFTLAQQALAAAGNVLMQLNFYTAGGEALSSFSFIVTVQPSVLNDAEVVSSDYYNILTGLLTQFAEQIEDLDNALRAGYGAPLKAATVSAMTDHAKIYVYTGSETGYTAGHWYYYNGTAWTDGGVYNAVAVNTDTTLTLAGVPADAKATGDAVSSLKSEIVNTSDELNITDYMFEFGTVPGVLNSNGEVATSSLHVTIADYVPVTLNNRYQIINSAGNTFTLYLCRYDSSKNLVGSLSVVDATNGVYNFSVNTEGVEYVRISVSKSIADKVTFKPRDARLTAIESDISANTTDIAESNNEIDNINKLLDTYNFIKTTSFSVGLLTNNGSVNTSQAAWNTTGFIAVESDAQYRIAKDLYPSSSFTLFVCLYNANEEFISYHSLSGPVNIKTTSETKYVKICVSASVAQQDIWLKLFPDRLTRIESDITGINDILIKDVIPVNATHAYTGEYLDMSAKNLFNIVRFMESASMAVPSGTTGQAFDIYKNYLVQFFADDKCRIYDITTGEILATIDVTSGHGNSACFSRAFYSNDDVLPLMYVSDTNGNVYLTRITITEATTITHLYFDSAVFGYASQVAEDETGNYVYACANATGGSYITSAKITKCDMTNLTDNRDGSYTPSIVDSFTIALDGLPGNNNVLQGVKYHAGKIFMTSGGNGASIKSVINVIDLDTETIAAFFGDFPDVISVPELEDVSLWLNPAIMKYEMVLYLRETAYYKLVL